MVSSTRGDGSSEGGVRTRRQLIWVFRILSCRLFKLLVPHRSPSWEQSGRPVLLRGVASELTAHRAFYCLVQVNFTWGAGEACETETASREIWLWSTDMVRISKGRFPRGVWFDIMSPHLWARRQAFVNAISSSCFNMLSDSTEGNEAIVISFLLLMRQLWKPMS